MRVTHTKLYKKRIEKEDGERWVSWYGGNDGENRSRHLCEGELEKWFNITQGHNRMRFWFVSEPVSYGTTAAEMDELDELAYPIQIAEGVAWVNSKAYACLDTTEGWHRIYLMNGTKAEFLEGLSKRGRGYVGIETWKDGKTKAEKG